MNNESNTNFFAFGKEMPYEENEQKRKTYPGHGTGIRHTVYLPAMHINHTGACSTDRKKWIMV